MKNLSGIIDEFKNIKILVVGDVMLDRFIWGDVERISPEAPVPVVKVTNENFLLGGSANVLNNVVALGGNAEICGVIGNDLFGDQVLKLLKSKKINITGVINDTKRATIVKTRVIGQKQQIVRVDREDLKKISNSIYKKLLNFIESNISKYDAVILSDYGKGLINKKFYTELLSIVKSHDKILNIDPKNSNMNIYKKATLLTPNTNEAGYAANCKVTMNNLEKVGKKLLKKFASEYLIITLGEKGMAIFQENNNGFIHIPTVAQEVFDVTGAGDTVISVLTMAMAMGVDVVTSAKIANIAAGVVVGKIGTATVTQEELKNNLYLV